MHLKVLSLRPEMAQRSEKPRDLFHDYPILGVKELDGSKGSEIARTVNADVIPFVRKMCVFSPRHGLSIQYAKQTVDVLICYECGDVVVYDSAGNGRWLSLRGGDPAFGPRSHQMLNDLLESAGIPIAP